MPATVIINRLTGAGPTLTPITSINTRANAADAHTTADTASPIIIVSGQTKYSYWVVTRLQCTGAPATLIDNIKWYTDGSNGFGTGVTCKGNTATSYVQATGTTGSGDQLTVGNYSTVTTPVDVFTFTSGSPKSVTGSTSTAVEFGDRFVYQIEVADTASPGATGSETFTWKFDET